MERNTLIELNPPWLALALKHLWPVRTNLHRISTRFVRLNPNIAQLSNRDAVPDDVRWRRLEAICKTFVLGYNVGLEEPDPENLRHRLQAISVEDRGFAFEGAAMAAAVGDSLPFSKSNQLAGLLHNMAHDYAYLIHAGAGWAMARLPFRRSPILETLDPTLKWLAWDGCGFHDAYFTPHRLRNRRGRKLSGYALRAYDQGVGRAVWFVAGGNILKAIELVFAQPQPRQPDLLAGLGLALGYAGGATEDELCVLSSIVGSYIADMALGVAFAAEARAMGNNLTAHADIACRVICRCNVQEAVSLVRGMRVGLPDASDTTQENPPYAIWRKRVRRALSEALR